MALQPATGARDLNPRQVELNQLLSKRLSKVYKKWGYEEVSPPRVERIDTLIAGGAISSNEIVRLVADEPLGLRPEMTASIARAAFTRLSGRPRPLRLWACGTIFETKIAAEGGISIEENLHSGVELFGANNISAEMELLSLLLEALETLDLESRYKPRLLIGHTGLMDLILQEFEDEQREEIKASLINFDAISLDKMEISEQKRKFLQAIQEMRGLPITTIKNLSTMIGNNVVINDLKRLFLMIGPIADSKNVTLHLDPTFQPHFELYTGLVFQLICQGTSAPVVIARGGRYDGLVKQCGAKEENSTGAGFSFDIEDIRELVTSSFRIDNDQEKTLIAYSKESSLERAFSIQRGLHKKGTTAIVELDYCQNKEEAMERLKERGCVKLIWVEALDANQVTY